ncbi:DMT family transporter [Nocardia sp. NBC_01503]|uniref:DMT family transporter n=1 Tax=Nocardia sp. NBC_01503 TaxID=2975997 RepID=UPI002E7B52C4|nr:DMT family transporter [Nocardia sp. NBC_01503]WTL32474.1 DMT family transporter [Nocardia sp. NBC_01503]
MQLPLGAVICAFIAALLFAVSAVAQQRAASEVPEGEGLMRALIKNPTWWAGMIGDGGGFAFQVAALALGSVLIVQPILVSALVFALPMAARYGGRKTTPGMWVNALALSVALAIFLIVGDPTEGLDTAPWHRWVLPLGLVFGVVAAGVIGARVVKTPALRALLLGGAGGTLVGVSAALTANVTRLFGQGITTALTSWEIYVLVVTGVGGVYLQQRGYQAGSLAACLPAFTIAEPLVAAFVGITVLDERLRSGPIGTGFVLVAVVVMCVATVALSRAQAGEPLEVSDSAPVSQLRE